MSEMQKTGRTIDTSVVEATEPRCSGLWDSFIKDAQEGQLDIKVDGSGNITGDHLDPSGNPDGKLNGKCTESTASHIIHFTRTDGRCTYTYDGVIGFFRFPPPAHFAIVGTVSTDCGEPHVLGGDEDWVGVKTT
jgi:hypothetical protein